MTQEANEPRKPDGDKEKTRSARSPASADVFFDFSGKGALDVVSLSILFTARQVAERRHREVWVAGLPAEFWSYLREMGLDGWFRQFPGKGNASA